MAKKQTARKKTTAVNRKSPATKQGRKPPHKKNDKFSFKKDQKKGQPGNFGGSGRKFVHKSKFNSKKKPEEDTRFEEVTQNVKTSMDGFAAEESDSDSDLKNDTRKMIQQQNRKKKKSGGFQSMGLSYPTFTGIIRKGYKIPTPIQRKTIPLILDGKDVVAMARTGSGKTAAFLIPMFERLKAHLTSGARALIMAPTRELAMQTLKFMKELGRFTGLKSAVILGGDSMDEQFRAIHENPDLIIATPGRFMHVLVEMELKLSSVEYVVFDEADRLFEMGFQEQLTEILQRLPESRQTLLFSATLPKLLVDFAKAGLHDPTLIRLDVDTKLSENLKMKFLQCRSADKLAVLLHLLRNVVKPSEQTVIFVATKHDVEYLNMVLLEAGFNCSYSYSALDQTARKINVAKFRNRKTMILLVTDLAARGIDIPLLDNVINYNFPDKSKLFVHRVGRVARAGSFGTAYSLIGPDELPYVLDLHLFLGRPLKQALVGQTSEDTDGMLGRVPQSVVDEEEAMLRQWTDTHEIQAMEKVMQNAQKNYLRSRPAPSSESIKRMKELNSVKIGYHPMFGASSQDVEVERANLLESMRNFKPRGTIFEINAQKKTAAFHVMKTKRRYHGDVIQRSTIKQEARDISQTKSAEPMDYESCDENDINETFAKIVAPKVPTDMPVFETKKKRKKKHVKDMENYVNYRPKDFNSELGLQMTNFDKDAASASLDLDGDDAAEVRRKRSQMIWDRKRKKYVAETGEELKKKKVKTESGQWIPATYKTNAYKDWLERTKMAEREEQAGDSDGDDKPRRKNHKHMEIHGVKGRKGSSRGRGPPAMRNLQKAGGQRPELKRKEQIIKQRNIKEKQANFIKYRQKKNKHKH